MPMKDSIAKHLDLMRRLGVGANASLVLLTHDADKGYMALGVTVDGGWTLEDGELDAVQTFIIVEKDDVDRAIMVQVKALAINGLVYELVGNGVRAASQSSVVNEWKFPVAPTGETWG